MLRTYRHHVPSVLMTHEDMMWVSWYVHQAISTSKKELKNPKSKAEYLKAAKLCALGFARYYDLMDSWRAKQKRVSLWPPNIDFQTAGHKIRIIAVPARESGAFGANLFGKIWEKDYDRGHTVYVLSCWYPPYVDLVGWLPRDELKSLKTQWWFQLEESVVRPMNTLQGLTPAQ